MSREDLLQTYLYLFHIIQEQRNIFQTVKDVCQQSKNESLESSVDPR